ncbi:hypothetical protein QL285_082507 [Trifolium repens]|nr:hypothetical protein QL285_082507 [Trifolium repens]
MPPCGLGVLDGREALFCVDCDEELTKFPVRKLCSIVGDHDLWDPEVGEDVSFEETEYVECSYVCKWFSFYPLGEIINGHDEVFVLSKTCSEGSEDIHAPPGKGPRRGQRLQLVWRS